MDHQETRFQGPNMMSFKVVDSKLTRLIESYLPPLHSGGSTGPGRVPGTLMGPKSHSVRVPQRLHAIPELP